MEALVARKTWRITKGWVEENLQRLGHSLRLPDFPSMHTVAPFLKHLNNYVFSARLREPVEVPYLVIVEHDSVAVLATPVRLVGVNVDTHGFDPVVKLGRLETPVTRITGFLPSVPNASVLAFPKVAEHILGKGFSVEARKLFSFAGRDAADPREAEKQVEEMLDTLAFAVAGSRRPVVAAAMKPMDVLYHVLVLVEAEAPGFVAMGLKFYAVRGELTLYGVRLDGTTSSVPLSSRAVEYLSRTQMLRDIASAIDAAPRILEEYRVNMWKAAAGVKMYAATMA